MYKKASVVAALSVMFLLIWSVIAVKHLWAHGSMEDPVSRVYQCYQEGPDSPDSPACATAVAFKGTQPFYDWNGVNLLAGGAHKQLIPDGKLCSANHAGFEGLDLPLTNWVAKTISPDQNGNYTFVYLGTAPHATAYFDYYITKDTYDPSKPLKWSDLETDPFCHTNAPLRNGRYTMTCPLPDKPGKRVIYNIWQRSDSAEAFYACIDVVITTRSGATVTPAPATATPVSATPQPSVTANPVSATPTPTRVTATATPQPGATRTPVSATPTLIPTRPGSNAPLGTNRVYMPLITGMTTE